MSDPSTGGADPKAPPALSIVIPAWNEAERLPPTLARIAAWIDSRGLDAEIIVIDDGSTDTTFAHLLRAADSDHRIRPIRLIPNRGKGAAVRAGMLAASAPLRLFTDADLSTPIEELNRLTPWIDKGFDIVIGSRDVPDARLDRRQSLLRETGGKVFNRIVRLLVLPGFHDTQCGFKLFTARAASVFEFQRLENFAFDVEILLLARRAGFKIREVGVLWRHMPDSRVHFLRAPLRMLAEVLRLRWNLLRRVYPPPKSPQS